MVLVIRTLRSDDTDVLAEVFANWPKPRELFETYAGRAASGDLDVLVAVADGRMAGFLIIEPHSSYPPFRAGNIPEIADFNVLPHERGHGVGTALMDAAERRVARRLSDLGLVCTRTTALHSECMCAAATYPTAPASSLTGFRCPRGH